MDSCSISELNPVLKNGPLKRRLYLNIRSALLSTGTWAGVANGAVRYLDSDFVF